MIPLYGFLEGDTLGLLVMAQETDSVSDLADRLQKSAAVRVERREGLSVFKDDKELPMHQNLSAVGFQPLDRFEVRAKESEHR